jgi:teichuronic acid biosynthesis glycosyltransferase TuaH
VAGLVGQVNERLDLQFLEATAARGVPLLIVGPLTARDPSFIARFNALVLRDNVTWVGAQPYQSVATYLARLTVGLVPYADSSFNRSSFPLKTLEYLGAGLRCVATPLPAVNWLGTSLVTPAATAETFAESIAASLAAPLRTAERNVRMAFAHGHSWNARAEQMVRTLGLDRPTARTGTQLDGNATRREML